MVTHSSILAWGIPWTQEPGGLQSMESQSRTQLSNLHFHFSAFTYPKSKAGYSNPITTQLIISLLLIIIFLSSSIDEFMGYFIFLPYQAELV